jgi:hypothetical protein
MSTTLIRGKPMNRNNLAEKLPDVKGPDRPSCPSYKLERFGVHTWNPAVDRLARQMWMPKGMRALMRKALTFAGVGPSSLPSTLWPVTQPKASEPGQRTIPRLRIVKPSKASEPGQRRVRVPEVTTTDLVDGRKFGKRIVTLRRKQGKRACQHIGKRFFEIATKNIGRGQVFYLAAGYGILESR